MTRLFVDQPGGKEKRIGFFARMRNTPAAAKGRGETNGRGFNRIHSPTAGRKGRKRRDPGFFRGIDKRKERKIRVSISTDTGGKRRLCIPRTLQLVRDIREKGGGNGFRFDLASTGRAMKKKGGVIYHSPYPVLSRERGRGERVSGRVIFSVLGYGGKREGGEKGLRFNIAK